jgi:uncharacterized membrane protein YdbT with pleckstrin-like domain
MPEETLWSGSSSQLKNLGTFAGLTLADLAIVAATIYFKYSLILLLLAATTLCFLWKWLAVRSRQFRLTTERILVSEGIFSRTTDSTELYRIKDLRMTQPFFLRLCSLENIELLTSDKSSPDIVIDYIPKHLQLGDQCRNQIEACRQAKGTREVEVE